MDNITGQFEERLNKLPKRLRDFIISETWDNDLTKILSSYIINDSQKTIISNELFLVLLMVTPYTELQKNIALHANLEMLMSEKIAEEIINTILQPISEEVVKELNIQENIEPKSSIGESFEQIILNQARAMQPAREEGEVDLSDHNQLTAGQAPENLPTENSAPETPKPMPQVPKYSGPDPYREPVE